MKRQDYYRKKWCGIYLITNDTTLLAYCGQSVDIFGRWAAHSGGSKSSAIAGAFALHPHVFSFRILEICEKSFLDEREAFYIEHLKTLAPLGYNKCSAPQKKLIKTSK